MAVAAYKGPLNVFGQASGSGAADYNNYRSPSMFDMGVGIGDPRLPFCYNPGNETFGSYGWWGTNEIVILDQVPSTITTTAIAASQLAVAGTAMTLVSATGAGITAGVTITSAATGRAVTGLLAIDGAMGYVQPGSSGGNRFWDPTKALARAVAIAGNGDDRSATFAVAGYDIYNYPMTETITGANAGTATGTKAFKYIASITPAGTLASTLVTAGQSDKIGLMLRVDKFQYLKIYSPDTTLISATTGFVAADTTDPATAVTTDVRGTYALQTASNNSRRLVITARIPLANCQTAAGLVGVTQV